MGSAPSLPSPGPAERGGDDSISGERRRHFSPGDRRPSKRKLVEEDGGASEVAALRAELEEERAAAATGASEAMAMILRLQREKGLLLMEMRQFRRVAEEKMAYQEQQLRALSGDLRACRHRLLLLHHGDAVDLSGDEEEEDDERDEEIAEIGSLGRRVQALEAEIRKISGRLGVEETEKPSSSSSSSPFNLEKTTAITRRNSPHQPWPIKFKRLIAEFVPHWILSLVCSRMIGGAAVGLLFLLFSIGFSRRIRLRRRLSHTTASKIR